MAMKGLFASVADFVDGADVGMVKRRSSLGFAPEAFECVTARGPSRRAGI